MLYLRFLEKYLPELDSIKLDGGSCDEQELESAYRKLKSECNAHLLSYLLQKSKKFDNTGLLSNIFGAPSDDLIHFTTSDFEYLKSKIFRDTKPLSVIRQDLEKLDYINRRKLKEQLLARFTSKSKIDNVFTFLGKRTEVLREISICGLYLTDNFGATISNLENLVKLHITGSEYDSLEFSGAAISSSKRKNVSKFTDKFFDNLCLNAKPTIARFHVKNQEILTSAIHFHRFNFERDFITDFLLNDFRREADGQTLISANSITNFLRKRMAAMGRKVFIKTNCLDDCLVQSVFETCQALHEFTIISVQANTTNISDLAFHGASEDGRLRCLRLLKLVNLPNLRIYSANF